MVCKQMKEPNYLFKDVDEVLELVNQHSKLNWEIRYGVDENICYLYDGNRTITFYGEYALWNFLAGYALGLGEKFS